MGKGACEGLHVCVLICSTLCCAVLCCVGGTQERERESVCVV